MRHIKMFEDYSDEELNDLIGDLEGIGHKGRLTQGEDFGFGTSLKEENDGGWFFTISDEAVKILLKRGILKPSLNTTSKEGFEFSNPQEWTGGANHYLKKYLPNEGTLVWRLNLPGVPTPMEMEILEKLAEKLGKVIL
jgi:hypothetical protein